MLFSANVGSLKDDEVASSVSAMASVHTRQAASAVASSLPAAEFSSSTIASPATGRLSKAEEKAEVTSAIKTGKRQKRLRNQQECISLDRDEKRASITTLYNIICAFWLVESNKITKYLLKFVSGRKILNHICGEY